MGIWRGHNMTRFGFGFIALGLMASAHASFELVLVADAGSKKIHRFDGISGAYLGNFGVVGGIRGGATSIVADLNTGSCFINEGAGINQYNYSTGALIRSYGNLGTLTSFSLSRDGKSIFAFNDTNTIRQYSVNTGTLVTTYTSTISGLKFNSGAESQVGEWVVHETSIVGGPRIRRMLADGTTSSGNQLSAAAVSGQSSTTARMDLSPFFGGAFANMTTTFAVGSGFGYSGFLNSAAPIYYYPDLSATNFASSVTLTAGSHAGGYFGGKNAGGNWVFARYSPTLTEQNVFSSGLITSPVSMTSVIAPEPTTMVAMALGLAAVSRRRKTA